jgi:hypothetical protein
VIYEGIAIDGMCLCMQNGQFTSDSQVQLETALSGTYTTPRINQMCQDFYSALGRQYTDQDALDCPSAMSDILVANTLYIVSTTLLEDQRFNILFPSAQSTEYSLPLSSQRLHPNLRRRLCLQ